MNKSEILRLVQESNPSNPLGYVHDIVRDYSIEKLNRLITNCTDCEIHDQSKSIAKGNSNAHVMIIGESANKETDTPFTIDELDILDKVFTELKINEEEIFLMATVNCFPYKKTGNEFIKRTPNIKEVKNCKFFLNHAIDIVQPLAIILMGSIAVNNFYSSSMSDCRGTWIEVKGIPTMLTFHPGYFIKIADKKDPEIVDNLKWDFIQDIKKVYDYLDKTYPNHNALLKGDDLK